MLFSLKIKFTLMILATKFQRKTQVLCDKLKKVYLMHISKDNNTPELAYNSLYEILERENKSHLEIEIINEEGTEIYKI